jgi:hypothetical protein
MRELSGEEIQDVSGGWSDDSGLGEFFVTVFLDILDAIFSGGPSAVDIATTTPTASNGP